MEYPLDSADRLAERLIAAIKWATQAATYAGDATPRQPAARDAEISEPLAAVAAALALISIARDIHRAVDMAAEFYFDDDEGDDE
jgi:hypothetical protein